MTVRRYDIAVVGAGPVGSFCALVHARKGARVALLEANPNAARRLAGEWLHPPAARMLRDAGLPLDAQPGSAPARGFVVVPEDGSEPIVLPYPNGAEGLICEHGELVSTLRGAAVAEPGVDLIRRARVRTVDDGLVTFAGRDGSRASLTAGRIVGADGRASIVRRSLGLPAGRVTCSRMVGVTITGARLPLDGFGQVLLGAPGQILVYGLAERRIRVVCDVPVDLWTPRHRATLLTDQYAGVLPEPIRDAFVEGIRSSPLRAAANEVRPRVTYGRPDRVLIGDAAGHHHPMTAVGMTLGFGDALALANSSNFDEFARRRVEASRVPECLAMGLYEVFADQRPETVALRHAVYRSWRASTALRQRTTRFLACEDASTRRLAAAFARISGRAIAAEVPRSGDPLAWRRFLDTLRPLACRVWWFLRGASLLSTAARASYGQGNDARSPGGGASQFLGRALLTSMAAPSAVPRALDARDAPSPDAGRALEQGVGRLLSRQGEDGGWEGELVWCPMLTAQYVLVHHLVERPLPAPRRRRLLRYFERTRVAGGGWGFHGGSPPHLFVTTLVYVAARLLGEARDGPLLAPAGKFLRAEGVVNVPSWGKYWLALLNLYEWRGVNPVLPELWALPRWIPLHPSNWYGFTRLIYTGLAAIHAHRYQAPLTPLIASLRDELFPQGFANVDFVASRNRARVAECHVPPGLRLRAAFAVGRWLDRCRDGGLRKRCVETMYRQIKLELRLTSHASQSPLSGLPNILALWLREPGGVDLAKALSGLERWVWEDADGGARVALQRSACWDTGFALQALAATPPLHGGITDALRRGSDFLRRQQLGEGPKEIAEAHRSDPRGGWCLGRPWQRWPLIDCTAEAALGIMVTPRLATDRPAIGEAVRFILDGQNPDGGFASYEARRSRVGVEWLNSSEMFSDVMNEKSYVECTASCLAALAACRKHFPDLRTREVEASIARGDAWLRRAQSHDGSWRGNWGVMFVYGTLFGIRGLVAAGARPGDPALNLACRWLRSRQRLDGGWGEHWRGGMTERFVPLDESQVLQTAWALMALLEADDPDWAAISAGARFLIEAQRVDGTWPMQEPAGVFGRTGLLDYSLYRQYFPLHALALYERRRRARLKPAEGRGSEVEQGD